MKRPLALRLAEAAARDALSLAGSVARTPVRMASRSWSYAVVWTLFIAGGADQRRLCAWIAANPGFFTDAQTQHKD